MYFPYFRGKQFELIALRELLPKITNNGKIIPIIEPVKLKTNSLVNLVNLYGKEETKLILLTNPLVGDLKNDANSILDLVRNNFSEFESIKPGFLISSTTTLEEINVFIDEFHDRELCLVHLSNFQDSNQIRQLGNYNSVVYNIFSEDKTSRSYIRRFRNNNSNSVFLEDAFNRQTRNEDYPENELFSDLFNFYAGDGFSGFGDYLIIGDDFSTAGGPAYTVAIHLTYRQSDEEIWIRHFLSESDGTPVDPGGKFLQALEKLIAFLDNSPIDFGYSDAIAEYRDLYQRQHFPGLGVVKKLSMKHHVELMDTLII